MDITATILEAAGVAVPHVMDSRSILPLCMDDAAEWPDQLVCEHNGHNEVIVQRIIIHKHYKYVAALFDEDELYDLQADPYEMNNLIDSPDYQEIKAELRTRLIEHIESKNDHAASRLVYALKNGF